MVKKNLYNLALHLELKLFWFSLHDRFLVQTELSHYIRRNKAERWLKQIFFTYAAFFVRLLA